MLSKNLLLIIFVKKKKKVHKYEQKNNIYTWLADNILTMFKQYYVPIGLG